MKVDPCCIAEFGFPTARPRCKRKAPAALIQLPLFICHHRLDHQMSAPNRTQECIPEESSWEKSGRPKRQGGEVQTELALEH